MRESREGGLIEREEQQLSEAALVFGDRRAREVMTPRSEIDFATIADAPRDIAEKAMKGGHTRLPLCDTGQGLEDAVGFSNAKDLLRIAFGQAEVDLRALARSLARVAESTRLDEVLREMRRDRRHLALVLDEHGTVVGLITLANILEELVGELEDEFDPQPHRQVTEARQAGDAVACCRRPAPRSAAAIPGPLDVLAAFLLTAAACTDSDGCRSAPPARHRSLWARATPRGMVPGHQCAEHSRRVRRTVISGGPSCGMRIEIGRLPWRSGATGRSP
jgi:hypothetical protein